MPEALDARGPSLSAGDRKPGQALVRAEKTPFVRPPRNTNVPAEQVIAENATIKS